MTSRWTARHFNLENTFQQLHFTFIKVSLSYEPSLLIEINISQEKKLLFIDESMVETYLSGWSVSARYGPPK